ncbi:hypothetical protein [Caulobacter sp. FWC26]|uniref:hypothetical protein n=1 Tax=Caulobacter sp. FWC26 TaxID=69665 RepID=UPI000C157AED|nr:hypothetical protein [Caulobacter sp. FWC26]AZS20068.1 hypothetical protein CSW63_05060 [Caulobacter sp. FWC26]
MASLAIARPVARPNQQSLRRRLEASIEAAIAALDALDGDSDLEDSFDQEAACEDDGFDADSEPDDFYICAWPDGEVDQTNVFARPWGA